ncbi:MAG: class I tRNA ligase family protein [Candidatus Pacebacteria bacterium]|nr:class I tRNA ligase family protein [Candidatus Paceibacterota bacterium]
MSQEKGPQKITQNIVGKDVKSAAALREEEILAFWQAEKIFEKTLAKTTLSKTANGKPEKEPYVFYDGPPFATGLPHYGHLLASTIKDVIPRYQTMLGRRVDRRWGWDCHGLPVENIVEKDLGVSGKKQIEAIGVEKFNEHARSQVLGFVHDWKKTIERIGRWVDFEGSYKTMDNTYMESVWWALKEMYDKGLVYESTKVLAYCPRCETPIANSEIAMDGSYRDITDISVYVKFALVDEPNTDGANTFILAWTTTPWTLPGNFALAINPDIFYVKIKKTLADANVTGDKVEMYWLAEDRVAHIFPAKPDEKPVEVLEKVKGSELVGRAYTPIFDYFVDSPLIAPEVRAKAWKIYAADFVTTESGTGVVHIAPGYGEDDLELAHKEGIPFAHHVQGDGRFMPLVKDKELAGLMVKPKPEKTGDHQSTDIEVIKLLAHRGSLFAKEKIIHSYPHCYRCDTPLFYYAIPSWFVRITKVKEKLLELNEKINWVPEHLKEGRFKKSMEGAPDWTISRNRYWASPLPIWKCETTGEVEFVGSLDELKNKTRRNRYIVMRHGEAEHNIKRVMISAVDAPYHLTEKGKEQIKDSAEKLKETLKNKNNFGGEKIDVIITSPLVRTRETAELVAKELGLSSKDIVVDDRIHEENFGDLEGKSFDEYWNFYKNPAERLEQGPQNGENLLDIRQRIGDFLYDIDEKYQGKNILVVTHDGPAKMFKVITAGASKEHVLDYWDGPDGFMHPGSFVEIDFAFIPHNREYELDLHRPYIDEVKWVSKYGFVKRIPEVIDCWFESGSMPFAANHYPFENQALFAERFPADFVSEYIAQTRTWFYYMHAVAGILFDNIPFKNVVTTGTVLAEDGQKMSKSKGNFMDPAVLLDKFGADPLRLYLLSSPLMKAEDLNFSEKGVDELYKKVILRLGNVVSFYQMYAQDGAQEAEGRQSKNVLDKWVLARLQQIGLEMTEGLESYQLDKASRPILDFVDDLSTWYLRRSRDRFKGDDVEDKNSALATLHFVLMQFATLVAPFMPFISEDIFLKIKNSQDSIANSSNPESVHLCAWPTFVALTQAEQELLADMIEVRSIVSRGLEARAKAGIKVRQPLAELRARSDQEGIADKVDLLDLIRDEVNVKEVVMDAAIAESVQLDTVITPELQEEGDVREIIRAIQEARKEKGLSLGDVIDLQITTDEKGKALISKYLEMIKKPTLTKNVEVVIGEKLSITIL